MKKKQQKKHKNKNIFRTYYKKSAKDWILSKNFRLQLIHWLKPVVFLEIFL